jgi:GNAT superfamily N-acetyltransferase
MVTLPDGVSLRRAERRDAGALGRLGAALMHTHFAFDAHRFMDPGDDAASGYADFLIAQLRDRSSLVMVAERGSEVIGYVYAGIEPLSWKELRDEAGFIHDLLVSDQARGSGVGEALLAAAIDWLRGQQMPRVLLWTAAPNDTARRLFERRGFRPTMTEMTLEL